MSVARDAHLVTDAFIAGLPARPRAGLSTDGNRLALYGNVIAEWRGDELWVRVNDIENAVCDTRGWGYQAYRKRRGLTVDVMDEMRCGNFEFNPTTLAKLSLIPGVHASRMRNQLYLNGKKWDGLWKQVQLVSQEV